MTSRRGFLTSSAVLAGMAATGLGPSTALAATAPGAGPGTTRPRLADAYARRIRAASGYLASRAPAQATNGDEARYANYIAQFHKTLPHDANGVVEPVAYRALVSACVAGDFEQLEAVPQVSGKLANPLGAVAFANEGWDSHHLAVPAASGIDSPMHASDMAECYWLSLTRDVPFDDYGHDPLVQRAVVDLRAMPGYGWVTPQTVFRGRLAGDTVGPYVSQFLLLDVPYGAMRLTQKMRVPVPGSQWMTDYAAWLAVQNGGIAGTIAWDPTPRRIANGAALAEWVHSDFSFEAFLNAALILLGLGSGALDPANPYRGSTRQGGFVTFGGPMILDLVARAARDALMACWFQKWQVHRKVRPEAYAGLVENTLNRGVWQHENPVLLASEAPGAAYSRFGTYLLPMAYPEGSPAHPSYPAGHGAIAGACTTVLKGWFDESFVLPAPKLADRNGIELLEWTGADLSIGGELNKLASNCTLARDCAGVHYRQDGEQGLRLGEQVGLALLREFRAFSPEPVEGFSLASFDGKPLVA